MNKTTITLDSLLGAYGTLPRQDRLHMVVRWRVCPLLKIAALVPTRGTILDPGCGHGLFSQLLARECPDRSVIGIDLDEHKIALAQQVSLSNLRFMAGNIADAELPPAAAVTILDVLYLVPYEQQEHLLTVCAEKLQPDGLIILKDMAESPHWKALMNWLEETLAVRVLRITASTESPRFYFRSRAEWQHLFRSLGFGVETLPLDQGYYHPHVVFVARKLAA